MKKLLLILCIAVAAGFPAANAAVILSGDFNSHGGTSTSIPSATLSAGIGVEDAGFSNVEPFTAAGLDSFLTAQDAINYAAVDENNNANANDPIFIQFDFQTSAGPGVTIDGASADVSWLTNVGALQNGSRTFGGVTFSILDSNDNVVGSLTGTLGDIANPTIKTISYTGTAFNLAGGQTYTARFAVDSDDNNSPGYIAYNTLEINGTAIPEPSAAVLITGFLALTLVFRRRR